MIAIRRVSRLLSSAASTAVPSRPPGPCLPSIPQAIWDKTETRLHLNRQNPLGQLKLRIERFFSGRHRDEFVMFDNIPPIVSTKSCFDDLLVPHDHVSRSTSDTYYVQKDQVLRPHMTAHDVPLLKEGHRAFIVSGDVYRRDTVDKTHYPVFHQMDGVRLFGPSVSNEDVLTDLKETLENLAQTLFGKEIGVRWVEGSFPFTDPSLELEVYWEGRWLEILGCGELRRGVLDNSGISSDHRGWAFGLGLERLAMVLYGISDIRLFWSNDSRFLRQFQAGDLHVKFRPFSEYPATQRDVAFWINKGATVHENEIHELVKLVADDTVEDVRKIDEFERDSLVSNCYRITFRHMSRTLRKEEATAYHEEIKRKIAALLPVEVR